MDNFIWEKYANKLDYKDTPKGRHGTSVCFITDGTMLLFGGESSLPGEEKISCFNDLWKFDSFEKSWTKINCTGTVPEKKSYHVMFYDKPFQYTFAGKNEKNESANEFHILDTENWDWKRVFQLESPLSRYNFSVCNGEFEKNKFIYGGIHKNKQTGKMEVLEDQWLTDYQSLIFNKYLPEVPGMKWDVQRTHGKHPGPRYGHTITMYDGKLYLFGGKTTVQNTGDNTSNYNYFSIFILDFDNYEWSEFFADMKLPIRYNFSCSRINDDQFLIHGGLDYTGKNIINDCYLICTETEKQVKVYENNSGLRGNELSNFPEFRFGASVGSSEQIHDDPNIIKIDIQSTRSLKSNPLNTAWILKVVFIGGVCKIQGKDMLCNMDTFFLVNGINTQRASYRSNNVSAIASKNISCNIIGSNREIDNEYDDKSPRVESSEENFEPQELLFSKDLVQKVNYQNDNSKENKIPVMQKELLQEDFTPNQNNSKKNSFKLNFKADLSNIQRKTDKSNINFDQRISFSNNSMKDNIFEQNENSMNDFENEVNQIVKTKPISNHKKHLSDVPSKICNTYTNTEGQFSSDLNLNLRFEKDYDGDYIPNSGKKDLNSIFSNSTDKNYTYIKHQHFKNNKDMEYIMGYNSDDRNLIEYKGNTEESHMLQREIDNLLRRKKHYQDSFEMKLSSQEKVIKYVVFIKNIGKWTKTT